MMRSLLLALALMSLAAFARGEGGPKPYAQAPIYKNLRARAFAVKAEDVQSKAVVYGVIMEIGYPEAVATLVSLADGTSSLYFSNGGGLMGAGEAPKVAAASKKLVSEAASELEKLALTTETPLPLLNHTRFYVLTTSGIKTADALEEDLGDQHHALSRLFNWAQAVITEIRLEKESHPDK
jgi:hypothetical protein